MVAVRMWEKVELADVSRGVTVVFQQLWQRDCVFWNWHAISENAQSRRILSGEKTYSTRHADGILQKEVVEIYSSFCHPVQMGRFDVRIAIDTQRIPPLLVSH